ncbi:MAG: hypothetical protein ACOCV4_06370 [Myxococcota bacterium]
MWIARLLLPLVLFVVPTVVIGYGFVIPGTCVAGDPALSGGFASAVVGAAVTYLIGVRQAFAEGRARAEAAGRVAGVAD